MGTLKVWNNEKVADYDLNNAVSPSAVVGSIYSGTDFNSSSAATSGTHIIQIGSAHLEYLSYLIINTTFKAEAQVDEDGYDPTITFTVERNQTGESSWSYVLPTTTVARAVSTGSEDSDINGTLATIRLPIALTDGERASGIDIKFTSITDEGSQSSGFFTNIITWFEGLQDR